MKGLWGAESLTFLPHPQRVSCSARETRVAGRRWQEWGVWPGLLLPTKTRQSLGTMTVELRNVSGVTDLGRTGCAVCKMPSDCTKMNLVRPSQSHFKCSSFAHEIQVFVPRRPNSRVRPLQRSSVRPSLTKVKCSSLADKGQVFVPRNGQVFVPR